MVGALVVIVAPQRNLGHVYLNLLRLLVFVLLLTLQALLRDRSLATSVMVSERRKLLLRLLGVLNLVDTFLTKENVVQVLLVLQVHILGRLQEVFETDEVQGDVLNLVNHFRELRVVALSHKLAFLRLSTVLLVDFDHFLCVWALAADLVVRE